MIGSIARVYRAAFSGLPRDVWLLSFIALVNRSGTMVLPFISLYLTRERGFSVAVAGQVLGLYGVGSMLGSYLGGWLSDRIGALRTQLLSLILGGVGFLLFAWLESLPAILVGVLILSTVAESFRPAVMTSMAQLAAPGTQVRAFALLRLFLNMGVSVGPAVGGVLALYSYHWLFVTDALTCWASALLLFVMIKEPARAPGEQARAEARRRASPWKDGPFLGLCLIVFGIALVFFQILGTLPLYFREVLGYRENLIGLLLGFNALLIVLFEMVLIHWAERRGRMLMIGVGSFLICLGFAMTPLGTTLALAALVICIWTVGEMLALPLINGVVADRATPETRGRYMGMYTMAFSAALVVAPLAGTWVYEHQGPNRLWIGVGLFGLPLVAGIAALQRQFRRRPA